MKEAKYNSKTRWPSGFDPEGAGAHLIQDVAPPASGRGEEQ